MDTGNLSAANEWSDRGAPGGFMGFLNMLRGETGRGGESPGEGRSLSRNDSIEARQNQAEMRLTENGQIRGWDGNFQGLSRSESEGDAGSGDRRDAPGSGCADGLTAFVKQVRQNLLRNGNNEGLGLGGGLGGSGGGRGRTVEFKQSTVSKLAEFDVYAARDAVVQVEPKTFFANERTLLDWASFCVMIGSVALGIINYQPSSLYEQQSYTVFGQLLMIIPLFFLLYALYQFRARQRLLMQKAISISGHYDRIGPALLTGMLCGLTVCTALATLVNEIHVEEPVPGVTINNYY